MLRRWVSTVRTLMSSSRAISLLFNPCAIFDNTWLSLGVSSLSVFLSAISRWAISAL
ncbi:hypothetical protein PS673_05273 [Pseudomonas fluorescens]|uniref:Uncharacterized protein n=1 Tax=Pseudomonas fluorescens TaxID=294 RepID=A0A5E6XDG6_PSEFL|nr:hypothetical protein PS673_05273 [Pseudomonas fluorescens]